jgi:hypothetical protein
MIVLVDFFHAGIYLYLSSRVSIKAIKYLSRRLLSSKKVGGSNSRTLLVVSHSNANQSKP